MQGLRSGFCCALLLVAAAPCVEAQVTVECDKAKADVPVERARSNDEEFVTSGDSILLKVTSTLNGRQVARVDVYLANRRVLEIGPEQLSNIALRPDGQAPRGQITVPVLVQINGSDRFQLNLEPDKSVTVTVLAYDDGVGAEQSCGHTAFGLRTGKVGAFAVVAGFNYPDYGTGFSLSYASRDAVNVANHLIDRRGVNVQDIRVFTDDASSIQALQKKGVRATPANSPSDVLTALREIYAEADPRASVFFYFSGHQYELDKSLYMVLGESELTKRESMLTSQDLFTAINEGKRRTISILDACFSGSSVAVYGQKAPKQVRIPGMKAIGNQLGRSPVVLPRPGINVRLYSSHADQPSWESAEFEHGVFTHFMLKAAEKADRNITLNDAFTYAFNETSAYLPKDAPANRPKQEPDCQVDSSDPLYREIWAYRKGDAP